MEARDDLLGLHTEKALSRLQDFDELSMQSNK
jgi:hypothetical protein